MRHWLFVLFFGMSLFSVEPIFCTRPPVSADSLILEMNRDFQEGRIARACSLAHELSNHYWFAGATDSSLVYSEKTYDWAVRQRDTVNQLKGLTNSAYNYQHRGDFQKAISCFEKAIALSEQAHDTLQWANSLENLSVLYGSTGRTDYPRSLELLLKAAKLKEDSKAFNFLPGTYKNISTVFKEVGDTVNREKYLMKSVALVDEGKVMNPTFQAAVYNEAGRFYTEEKPDYPKAWEYFGKVLEVSKKLKWKKGISVSLSNMANVK
ncbi:MAG TPA: tetratricopeptide repeat protein, partial [Prolixibacteraceae bacterium]|nr:tetratricopeptide repeat protein [Prolixibacteraceae bacterium]